MPRGGADPLADHYRAALGEARERTLTLTEGVSEHNLSRQHDRRMSPLVWDLGHIAAFEDLWLCQRVGGLDPLRPDLAGVYDAAETMLQTLVLAAPGVYSPSRFEHPPAPGERPPGMVRVEAGPFEMGDPDERFAYDNERPRHRADVAAFEIDVVPVTNGDFEEFVTDGGYQRDELWSVDGLRWRFSEGVQRPLYWTATGGERRFDSTEERDPDMPVMHVSWFEADAFARWRGARLPTEAEWEKAAAHDPSTGSSRRLPWGDGEATAERANLDQLAFGPVPAGSLPAGASAYGVLGMIGDCWEWTASTFGGYPGFEPFPYREYSEVFFGDTYRVLRGCSWATRTSLARNTQRNWDLPERRQIFAGFRCARDSP